MKKQHSSILLSILLQALWRQLVETCFTAQ